MTSHLDVARWVASKRPDIARRIGLYGAVKDVVTVREWHRRLCDVPAVVTIKSDDGETLLHTPNGWNIY